LVIKTLNPNPDPEPDPKPDPDPKPEPDSLETLNPDPDSMNPDLHCNAGTRVLTSGEQKLEKFTAKKKFTFFDQKLQFTYPWTSIQDV
jgi:hypothetical protein